MSIMFVKRTELPTPVKGKVGTLSVTITGSGQIQLSSIATKFFEGAEKVFVAFEGGKDGGTKVYLFRADAKAVAKVNKEYAYDLKRSKKGGTAFLGASIVLQNMKTYGASFAYNYKESGNQSFPVVEDEKNGNVNFEIPAEKIAPKPVVARKKKAVAPAVAAAPGDESGKAVGVAAGDELVLDAA